LSKQFQQIDIFWRKQTTLFIGRLDMRPVVQKPNSNFRIDGLDVARGIALIAMASYHFSWDLEMFGYLASGTASIGFLKYYARAIASSFLFIVGFSLVLATLNGVKWRSFLIRLAQVGAAALVISVATYYAVPEGWIFFGILHHIILASLIGLLFVRLHWAVVLLSAAIAFALPHLGLVATETQWLSFLGLYAVPPSSNDFVPLLPWLSASLTGIAAAKFVTAHNWLETFAKPKATKAPARQLKFLGRHSLLFYILHQPVLIGLVWTATQLLPPDQRAIGANFQNECRAVCEKQYDEKQCQTYCNCFETELNNNAAQWSQLPAQDKSKAISEMCSKLIQQTVNP
jgi:uncharacterized membrane protein